MAVDEGRSIGPQTASSPGVTNRTPGVSKRTPSSTTGLISAEIAPVRSLLDPAIVASPSSTMSWASSTLDWLVTEHERARQEGATLALIEGAPGMGSSLLDDVAEVFGHRGALVLRGRCRRDVAFSGFSQLSQQVESEHGSPLDWLDARAAGLLTHRPERRVRSLRVSLFHRVRDLLSKLPAPPVVILDNIDQADEGSLELLEHLLAPLWDGQTAVHALFVALCSDTSSSDRMRLRRLRTHGCTVRQMLKPLDPEGVRSYLVSHHAVQRVMKLTGGLPEQIDALLEGRMEPCPRRLHPDWHAIVEALSLTRTPKTIAQLERVAHVSLDPVRRRELPPQICGQVRLDLDARELQLSFRRESDRELVMSGLDPARRREIHGRFARAHDVPLSERVFHAEAASELGLATELAIAAADELAAAYAHQDAVNLLQPLVNRLKGESRLGVMSQLADLLAITGELAQAIDYARDVSAARPDDAVAACRFGRLLIAAGRKSEAVVALENAGRLPGASEATTRALLAETLHASGLPSEAETHARAALDLALGQNLEIETDARNTLGKLALQAGDLISASELFARNLQLAESHELSLARMQALTNLGIVALQRQDRATAAAHLQNAAALAATHGAAIDRAIALENLGVLAHRGGQFDTALEHYEDAAILFHSLGNRDMLVRAALNMAQLRLILGAPQRAATLVEWALESGGESIRVELKAEGRVLLGEAAAALGDFQRARDHFEGVLADVPASHFYYGASAVRGLADVAIQDHDPDAAEAMLEKLAEATSPLDQARRAVLEARLLDLKGDLEPLTAQQALAAADLADDDRCRIAAGVLVTRSLLARGRRVEARRFLRHASDADERMTAHVPVDLRSAWRSRPERADLDGLAVRLEVKSDTPSTSEERLVGGSVPMRRLRALIERVAPSRSTVLITGESGVGKELVAAAIHEASSRSSGPFVKVNCGALVETLLLSELFGHERGAFTGATNTKRGRFELADGGTIFLDEIGDISAATQVALLRVLQERELQRVGGSKTLRTNVRIIAATHRDLQALMESGEFRQDLYYRLRGVEVPVPSLRARKDDIPALGERLLRRIEREEGGEPHYLSDTALAALQQHPWPGNVRELENVLRTASMLADKEMLEAEDVLPHIGSASIPIAGLQSLSTLFYDQLRSGESIYDLRKSLERESILRAYEEAGGNVTQAAKLLGMKRPRLSQLIKEYGIRESNP